MADKQQIKEIVELEGNDYCIDCGAQHPLYVCVMNGVFICEECSLIHKELESSISIVKPIMLTEFNYKEISILKNGGNLRFIKNLNEFGLIDQSNPFPKNEKMKDKYLFAASTYYREILFFESDQGERPLIPALEEGQRKVIIEKEQQTQPGENPVIANANANENEEDLVRKFKIAAKESYIKSKSMIQDTSEKFAKSEIGQSLHKNGTVAVHKIGNAGDFLSDKASELAVSF